MCDRNVRVQKMQSYTTKRYFVYNPRAINSRLFSSNITICSSFSCSIFSNLFCNLCLLSSRSKRFPISGPYLPSALSPPLDNSSQFSQPSLRLFFDINSSEDINGCFSPPSICVTLQGSNREKLVIFKNTFRRNEEYTYRKYFPSHHDVAQI